jgi:hydroxymethylpyrimidine/phosphomethylpyrimidine kinase
MSDPARASAPPRRPQVLCLSGHDPTGGAGLQADIEAVAAGGGHALGLITALTVQDSHNVRRVLPVALDLLREQAEVLLADCRIDAIKVGLLADDAQAAWIASLAAAYPVPLVLDPVLRAGGGAELAPPDRFAALWPWVQVLTPNQQELERLVPQGHSLLERARVLCARGCTSVLVTGGDAPGAEVYNHWITAEIHAVFRWPRVDQAFHGAGCTLAARLAVALATGLPLPQAISDAQQAVHQMLQRAHRVGTGRAIPGRAG